MGKITLVTGGSRSGKSNYAEKMFLNNDKVLYIATSKVTDKDMEKRVELHRKRRNRNWNTHEGYKDLGTIIKKSSCRYIILECIGTLIANMMFDSNLDFDKVGTDKVELLENKILQEVRNIISSCRNGNINAIIITSEVGLSLVPEYRLGRIFSDILGKVNQSIADSSDEVYIVFCGLPMKLK